MSEVRLAAPVEATRSEDIDEDETPGAFGYYVHGGSEDYRGMIYRCPCGCGRLGALPFHPLGGDDKKHYRDGWHWDGNRDKPTLTPSVHHVGHWHGYLRDGFWVQA